MGVDLLKELALADHLIYVTMPLLNDKQLIINAAKHLNNALTKAIINYMKQRTITHDEETIINEFLSNKEFVKYSEMIHSLRSFVKQANKYSIKLKRKDKIIIINQDYNTTIISEKKLKDYIKTSKELINKLL